MEKYCVNISSVKEYMRCRYRWTCKWVLNRVPRKEPVALTFGKLFHLVFEDYLNGVATMAHAIEQRKMEWRQRAVQTDDLAERDACEEAIAELDKYAPTMQVWQDRYTFDIPTLEVEEPFEVQSPFNPYIWFKGRPDRVGVLYGRVFHVQNRSLSPSLHFGTYAKLAERHLHELVYGYALARKYPGYPYGGTVLNLLRKLKPVGKATKKFPEGKPLHDVNELMWQGLVNLSEQQILDGMSRATEWAEEMQETQRRFRNSKCRTFPLPNEELNGGFAGNTIDPYFRVMQGEVDLYDDRWFKNREEMYAGIQPEANG